MEPRGGGRAAARRRLLLLFVGLLPAAAGLWSTHGTEDSPEAGALQDRHGEQVAASASRRLMQAMLVKVEAQQLDGSRGTGITNGHVEGARGWVRRERRRYLVGGETPRGPEEQEMAQEDDEDEDRGKGLEPTLEEILRAQNNSATATANDVIDSKADVSGVEVVEPSEAEQMHEPVVEAAAEEAEEDKGQTNGGEATTTIGHVTYIKMMSCGAAPADMVPFERAKSPWGEAKDFFGVMQPNDLPGGGGRKLMEAVPIGLPEPHEFGGLLKAVGDEDGDREEEEALRGGRGAGDERWDAMARTALDEDLRGGTPGVNATRGGGHLYLGPRTVALIRGMQGQERHRGDDDSNNSGEPQRDEDEGCEDYETSGRSLMSARRRPAGRNWDMRATGCSKKVRKVVYENDGYGPKAPKKSRPGDGLVKGCINDPSKCTLPVFSAASGMTGVKQLQKLSKASLGKKRYKSCALVGNAGHLIKKNYGPYIDRHEAVVRFNILALEQFEKHVGKRTTFRVLNNSRSADACCTGKLPEGKGSSIGLVLWYPAGQGEMKSRCRKKYPMHKVYTLDAKLISQEVSVFNSLRKELQQMGLGGGLGNWRQLTSGGHAVLLFSKVCDSISLYGFTTWGSKGPDQYGGRSKKTGSGQRWHDWGGESLVWRLLFAAGKLQICSR